jgi:hypothetical protein
VKRLSRVARRRFIISPASFIFRFSGRDFLALSMRRTGRDGGLGERRPDGAAGRLLTKAAARKISGAFGR